MKIVKRLIVLLIIVSFAVPAFSEDNKEEKEEFAFNMEMELGAETLYDDGSTDPVSYQKLSLYPDISFGKVGIGLALTFHYRFEDSGMVIRSEDWTVSDDRTFLDVYLPIFRYVRYGYKGDPFMRKSAP